MIIASKHMTYKKYSVFLVIWEMQICNIAFHSICRMVNITSLTTMTLRGCEAMAIYDLLEGLQIGANHFRAFASVLLKWKMYVLYPAAVLLLQIHGRENICQGGK